MNRRSSSFIRARYTQAIGTMFNWIRNLFLFTAAVLATLTLGPILGVDAADAPSSPVYVVKGDLAEVKSKGAIRFLVHGEADYLPAPAIHEQRNAPWRKT
jgi:hypothetical protein